MAGMNATPPQEEQPNGAYATYVPHDLPYNASFEDSLMQVALDSTARQDGIRIIPDDSAEQAENGISVRSSDVSLHSLPIIAEHELPLPLDDPRRIFTSAIPGVKLTHPGGYLEGGPGLAPELDTFPDDFFQNHPDTTSPDELRKAIRREVDTSVELLKQRLRERRAAKQHNEQIEKELKALHEQHEMEMRMLEKMAGDQRRKKEAKERRKREREGG